MSDIQCLDSNFSSDWYKYKINQIIQQNIRFWSLQYTTELGERELANVGTGEQAGASDKRRERGRQGRR